jgi:DNA-binding winged helix-turn-helix (wHTH) protein/TolB-like protein/Tfp pilus assembly protein PilF
MASRAYIARASGRIYEFGNFRLDEAERLLSSEGEPVSLAPKVFETLLLLVQNAGHLVDKDELMKSIWPDSFVEEVNLNRSISTLRRALGEKPNEPRYIETVPKRGYRFIAQVTEAGRQQEESSAQPRPAFEILQSEASKTNVATAPKLDEELGSQASDKSGQIKRKSARLFSRRAAAVTIVIVLAISAIIYFATRGKPTEVVPAAKPKAISSLAVLPFKVLRATEQDQYLEIGMADVLITTLSNIKEINARPTSAVIKYSNAEQSPIEIGRALKVDAVLEGSVQKVDDRIRVTVRLLDVNKESPLWAGKFDEPAADILKVQDSIAERVANALSVELKSPIYTRSAKAQELYVKGRLFFNQRDQNGIEKAELCFREAIEEDPNFALAYSGLSDIYTINGGGGSWGEATLKQALKLGGALGEVYASQGFRLMFIDWNWDGAEEAFKRALELKPDYVTTYQWYANLLAITGRLDEAKEMLRRGLEIDPSSYNLMADLGQFYYFSRDYDKALEFCQKALETYPDFIFAHDNLRDIYLKQGRYEESIDTELRAAYSDAKNYHAQNAQLETAKQLLQAAGGWEGYIRNQIKDFRSKRNQTFSLWGLARNYALLGDKKQALKILDQAYYNHLFMLAFVGADPIFDNLRAEPRYQNLLRRIGLARWLEQH